MEFAVQNLKFILWNNGIDQKKWPEQLAGWVGDEGICSVKRAEEILYSNQITDIELSIIAERQRYPIDELKYTSMIETMEINILAENLKYLINSLESKGKKNQKGNFADLADYLGVTPITITRWRKTKHVPKKVDLEKIAQYFELSNKENLKNKPLFLELDPVGARKKKKWLHDCINQLNQSDINELYPALKRLFKK